MVMNCEMMEMENWILVEKQARIMDYEMVEKQHWNSIEKGIMMMEKR